MSLQWTEEEIRAKLDEMAAGLGGRGPIDPNDPTFWDYHAEYLTSKLWAKIKRRVLKRDNKTCASCGGLKGEIKSRFKTSVVQSAKFSELLQLSLTRYRNRAIETAQVIEELIEMARKFQVAAQRGESLGLNSDEMAFYDALAMNEAAVRELGDETLKKIAVELTQSLRKSVTVDWAKRETVRAKLRVMVKTLLRRYKYPPDRQEEATDTVLRQAETLSADWVM